MTACAVGTWVLFVAWIKQGVFVPAPGCHDTTVACDQAGRTNAATLNEWHALIVRHGQRICRKTQPLCGECPLLARCAFGQSEVGA